MVIFVPTTFYQSPQHPVDTHIPSLASPHVYKTTISLDSTKSFPFIALLTFLRCYFQILWIFIGYSFHHFHVSFIILIKMGKFNYLCDQLFNAWQTQPYLMPYSYPKETNHKSIRKGNSYICSALDERWMSTSICNEHRYILF